MGICLQRLAPYADLSGQRVAAAHLRTNRALVQQMALQPQIPAHLQKVCLPVVGGVQNAQMTDPVRHQAQDILRGFFLKNQIQQPGFSAVLMVKIYKCIHHHGTALCGNQKRYLGGFLTAEILAVQLLHIRQHLLNLSQEQRPVVCRNYALVRTPENRDAGLRLHLL